MDYVLFGMGYGATLMLLGWALRTFGPERKYADIDPNNIDDTVLRRRWVRFIQGLGGVIAIAGTAMVLFTFVTMLMNPDDETGSFTTLVIWGFLVIAVLAWCWFYVSSYGLTGIWSRTHGYGLRKSDPRSQPRKSERSISTSRVITVPDGDEPETDDVPEEPIEEPEMTVVDDEPMMEEPEVEIAAAEPDADQAVDVIDAEVAADVDGERDTDDETANSDPEYDFGDSSDTTVPREIGGRSEAIRRIRERQAKSEQAPE